MKLESLFVYGTLKKGEGNHKFLVESRFVDKAKTLEEFCMYEVGGIPVVTHDEVCPIHGEFYRVTLEKLQELDLLELGYTRYEVPVVLPMSGTVKAWMYICDEEDINGILIREGKWR